MRYSLSFGDNCLLLFSNIFGLSCVNGSYQMTPGKKFNEYISGFSLPLYCTSWTNPWSGKTAIQKFSNLNSIMCRCTVVSKHVLIL